MGRVFALKNVRIYFKKMGRMKFVSHLDMTRVMSRLIKKSGIPIWYTEGFNRHIYMNFALPLSLGYEGTNEVMDIRIIDDEYPLDKVLASLQAVCPPDIEIIKATNPVKPTKEIGFADYVLAFDEINCDLKSLFADFFSKESVTVEKKGKKGKVKKVDIMPKIKACCVGDNTLTLQLVAGSEDNLNPALVMDAFFEIFGLEPVFYTVTRTSILDKQGNPFI